MFRNYLLITFRNLYKNRIFALINIVGLGIALSICIVSYFNHMFGYDFDRWHEHFEEIYRVSTYREMQDRNQEYGIIPARIGLEIKEEIPAVESAARLMRSYSPVKVGIDIFNRQISYVDPEFLDIFTFYLVQGNKEALKNPNNVLISKDMADVLYGDKDPMGQPVSIFNDENIEFTYTVGGVFRDLPQNSSFRIDVLTHLENFLTMWEVEDTYWYLFARALFIRVPNAAALPAVSEGFEKYIPAQNEANESFKITGFNFVPLDEVGDNSRDVWSNSLFPGLHPAAVIAPLVMAILMLLIASFNFANTAIAVAGKRLMEIGIRKMAGGVRRQLLFQFLIENYIICFLALLVGILVAYFLVPAYSSLWEYMTIILTFSEHWSFWVFLILLLMITGFLAGAYPALYISRFRPLTILQGRTRLGAGGPLSKLLLGFQFTISVLAIVSGIIFSKNAVYQETVDLGYARDELIVVPIRSQHFTSYYESVIQDPRILQAAGTQEHIGFGNYRRSIKDEQTEIEVNIMDVGPEYLQTMGLRTVDGRTFNRDRAEADRGVSVVINRMMADAFGWEQPIGKQIWMNDTIPYTIIGMVEDFFTNGMWAKIEPTLLKLAGEEIYYSMAIRAESADLPGVLESLRETWTKLFPNYPFTGRYQEDTLEEEKSINRSIKQIYIFLAVVATLLSMTGLYTLISLSILNRTKEIGIRKVMGAEIRHIFVVLSRGFLINLAISSILGCVGGYFLSISLMESIWDHFTSMTAWVFIFTILIIFGVTLITTAGRIYAAATQNPADCLRYE
jgi:ABC-type antimicrobial peptide transport system permease subunit